MCKNYASYDAELVKELMKLSGPMLVKRAKESCEYKYELYLVLTTKKIRKKIKDTGQVQAAINGLKWWMEMEGKVNDLHMRALSQSELDKIYSTKKIVTSSNGNEFRNHALGAC